MSISSRSNLWAGAEGQSYIALALQCALLSHLSFENETKIFRLAFLSVPLHEN